MLRRMLGLLVAAGLLAAAPARAEGKEHHGDCRADVEEHCADVAPGGGGALGRCLREHEPELSPACRAQLATRHEQMKERADELLGACQSDLSKHCPDKKPGEGGLIRCLRDHEADLSAECRAALPERRRP